MLAQESATLCPPSFSQLAVSAYLDKHDWLGQIKQFREMYRERRDAMVEALDDMMPAAARWNVPTGGFYVWLTLPDGLDAKAMLPRAVTARVAFVPGTAFFADGFGAQSMRLSYCYPTPERIREGVRRLVGVIEEEVELRQTFGTGARPRGAAPSSTVRLRRPEDGPDHDHRGTPVIAVRRHRRRVVLAGGLSHERDVSLRSGPPGRRGAARGGRRGRRARRGRRPAAACCARTPPTACCRCCTARPARTARSARCSSCVGAALRRLPAVGLPRGVRQAGRQGRGRPRRHLTRRPSVALPHETFRELGAAAVMDAIVATHRPAADREAGPRRLRAGLHGRSARRPRCAGAMVNAFAYGDTALVERFVVGTEVAVPVVDTGEGPRALPVVSIEPDGGVYDYAARYTAGSTEFHVPAKLVRRGGRRVRPGRGRRPRGPRAARPVPLRPDHRRRRAPCGSSR